MRKAITFILTALFVGVGYSQKKTATNKDVVLKQRTVSPYQAIEVSGGYSLVLTEGEIGTIQVKAPENIQSYIETQVFNNTLYISIDKKYSLKTSVIVYVPINTQVKKITGKGAVYISTEKKLPVDALHFSLEGAGYLKTSLTASSLDLQVAGTSSINIAGETKDLNVLVKGAGSVTAKGLTAEKATLRIAGAGSISAYVTQEVDASIAGVGNITIKGNPPVFKKNVEGVGRIKIEE